MRTVPLAFALFTFIATPAGLALAETCDAGHGCTVTCKDGCGAVYFEPNGPCRTFCSKGASAKMSKAPEAKQSVKVQGLSAAEVLELLKKPAPAKK